MPRATVALCSCLNHDEPAGPGDERNRIGFADWPTQVTSQYRCGVGCKVSDRSKSSATKTDAGRGIEPHQTLTSALKTATRYVRCPWVFRNLARDTPWQVGLRDHVPSITHAFERACRTSGVSHATFHNLRQTFVTNGRHAGISDFRITVLIGQTTRAVFRRDSENHEQDLQRSYPSTRPLESTTHVGASEAAGHSIDNSGMGR